ncbi:MAG: hypothetical protein AAFV69_00535 [Pseudomonadota bacterium]
MHAIRAALVFALLLGSHGAGLSAEPADSGVRIVNSTSQAWQFSIVNGPTRSGYTLEPAQVLTGLCPDGCTLVLKGATDGTYILEGNERLAVEDGVVYYDDVGRRGAGSTPKRP